MTMSKNRGADVLVQSLRCAGVKRVFTLSGNHIMPVFDAALDAGIELIHTRHEAAAVHMADAWARLTGETGVAMVTGGPGHANAVSALYTAQMAESPVLLLSGHAPLNQIGMGAFQEMRQADMAAPVTKAAWTVASADVLAENVGRALRTAASGRRGPVHLSLPTDTLESQVHGATQEDGSSFRIEPLALNPDVAVKVLQALEHAKRPLILCGPACTNRQGSVLMAEAESACGVPVVAMESPRGTGDPCLGAFPEMLARADFILLVGKRLDFTLKFGRPPAFDAACRFMQVDPDTEEIERARRAVGKRLVGAAQADVFSTLRALTRAAGRPRSADHGWLQEVKAAIAYRPPEWNDIAPDPDRRLHPANALRPLQAVLDSHPDAVLVCDGGEFSQWAQACLKAPNRVINGIAGAIGPGLPFALAARIAKPDAPVVAVMGDGTFGFHASEIDTAFRYSLPFLCVVGNDARWNAEYQIQLREYGKERLTGCDLLPTRYDQVAAAFGGHGELVTAAGQMQQAIDRALASRLPACLNIMIDGLPAPNIKY